MHIQFTKKFLFSASFNRYDKIIGHNYVLGVETDSLDGLQEKNLEEVVNRSLLDKINSKDLTMDVDFLKNIEINEMNLLKAFWSVLEPAIKPITLRSLFLEKDSVSRVSLAKEL